MDSEMQTTLDTEQNEKKGTAYSAKEQELIHQLVQARLEQKEDLPFENLDGYELPPRTQFSMLKKPAVSIKYGRFTCNMACIRLFEGVRYILPIVNREKNDSLLSHARKKKVLLWSGRDRKKNHGSTRILPRSSSSKRYST